MFMSKDKNRKNIYYLRNDDKLLFNLIYDPLLTKNQKSKLMAESLNENVFMNNCSALPVWQNRIIPIRFKQQPLTEFHLEHSGDCQIIDTVVIRIMFHKDTKEADFLIAQTITFDDMTGNDGTQCRIYFSPKCTSDMAVTAFFMIRFLILNGAFTLSNATERTMCSRILKRYGKKLTPPSLTHFWVKQMDAAIKDIIYFRDRTLRINHVKSSKLYRRYNSFLKLALKRKQVIDVNYDPNRKEIHLLIELGNKQKIFWLAVKNEPTLAKSIISNMYMKSVIL